MRRNANHRPEPRQTLGHPARSSASLSLGWLMALPLVLAFSCQLPDESASLTASQITLKPAGPPSGGHPTESPAPSAPSIAMAELQYTSSAVQVGDPLRARFSTDTMLHSFARSIRAMVTYGDRILLGSGDYWNNSGPTDLWALTEAEGAIAWSLDFTVDDEMVNVFRVYDGTLYVPGTDATENWSFGNFYTLTADGWTKHRTVPNALHVVDIAEFQGDLYVHMWDEKSDKILKSTDDGATWSRLTRKPVYGRLIALDDVLLIFGETPKGSLHTYDGARIARHRFDVFPGSSTFYPAPDRLVRFRDGVAYATVDFTAPEAPALLYFLNDFEAGPAIVGPYGASGQKNVRDLLVVDDTLYVLSAQPDPARPGHYLASVDSTRDLNQWLRIADFSVPAPPYSFAQLNGSFYVGLGADSWWFDSSVIPTPASGSVWRLVK